MSIYADMIEESIQSNNRLIDWVLSNLSYTTIPYEEVMSLESELCQDITPERLSEIYYMVKNNLPEPIENGLSYNMADIHRKLNEVLNDPRK